jgi:hypothetical protein
MELIVRVNVIDTFTIERVYPVKNIPTIGMLIFPTSSSLVLYFRPLARYECLSLIFFKCIFDQRHFALASKTLFY